MACEKFSEKMRPGGSCSSRDSKNKSQHMASSVLLHELSRVFFLCTVFRCMTFSVRVSYIEYHEDEEASKQTRSVK